MKQLKRIFREIGQFILRNYLLFLLLFAAYRASTLHVRFYNGILYSDAEGYYLYLPALFINGGFEGLFVRTEEQFPMYPETKKRFTKYTCGLAIVELPFFLAAHVAALLNGMPADGYSPYYVRGIQFAALLYGFLGLLVLRRVLERHFSPWITFFTLVGLYFGTNLMHYHIQEPGMSHIYSFFLFAVFMYHTPRFWERPGWKIFTGMGLLLGLITLIRPTNVVILLYLLLYDIRSKADLVERGRFIGRHFGKLLLAPLASFVVFIPQFLYWKHLSGNWFIYSYGDEGFIYWNMPRVDMVLFHIKNGWLLFSPMAGLAVLGCLIGIWKNRYNILPVFLVFLISLYLFSSWWSWWFGGALGQRSFVEFYTLLALPYAYLAMLVFRQRWLIFKLLFVALWLALMHYSYFLTVYFIGPHYDWQRWRQVVEWMLDLDYFQKL